MACLASGSLWFVIIPIILEVSPEYVPLPWTPLGGMLHQMGQFVSLFSLAGRQQGYKKAYLLQWTMQASESKLRKSNQG